jgi:lysophospholipase L1-like esterase
MSRAAAAFPMILVVCSGACEKKNSPTSPTDPAVPADIYYTALGASDAIGVGASVPCLPFAPCPNGTGYVPIIARGLDDGEARTVTLANLGIPTAVIGPHFEALGRQYGRDPLGNFLDREVPFVPRNSTHVTIFAGGNDSNTVGAAIRGGAGGANPAGYIRTQIGEFGSAYDSIIRGIRDRAGSPRIVVANLPNYAGIPLGRTFTPQERQAAQLISVGFSQVINRLTSQGVLVVDLLCDSRFYEERNYADDGFHMSDGGYAIMADEMLEALTTGSHPPPSSNCPQMTIVPNP